MSWNDLVERDCYSFRDRRNSRPHDHRFAGNGITLTSPFQNAPTGRSASRASFHPAVTASIRNRSVPAASNAVCNQDVTGPLCVPKTASAFLALDKVRRQSLGQGKKGKRGLPALPWLWRAISRKMVAPDLFQGQPGGYSDNKRQEDTSPLIPYEPPMIDAAPLRVGLDGLFD
jgi:hypothetical protein